MTQLFLAILVFLAAHVIPAATGLRSAAVARIGRGAYVALYSVVSLASLIWVVAAALTAPLIPLWPTSRALALIPIIAMAPACVLFVMGAARPNPVSVSFRGGPVDPERPGVTAVTRHPILWAFFLWGGSHAIANGDAASLVLFGGSAAFSLVGMRVVERRAIRRGAGEAMSVADGPLAGRLKRALDAQLVGEALAGAALYLALAYAHGPVLGVWPFDWLG